MRLTHLNARADLAQIAGGQGGGKNAFCGIMLQPGSSMRSLL